MLWGCQPISLMSLYSDPYHAAQVHFTLHILHIDESAALGLSAEQAEARAAAVAEAAAPYCQDGVQYHCVPLEAVFGSGSSGGDAAAADSAPADLQRRAQQREQLTALLAAVPDATGRQDLARHLRARMLLHAASVLGCKRMARGDCATTLATHIVAAASKGCGYSLPGDVRLVDAR